MLCICILYSSVPFSGNWLWTLHFTGVTFLWVLIDRLWPWILIAVWFVINLDPVLLNESNHKYKCNSQRAESATNGWTYHTHLYHSAEKYHIGGRKRHIKCTAGSSFYDILSKMLNIVVFQNHVIWVYNQRLYLANGQTKNGENDICSDWNEMTWVSMHAWCIQRLLDSPNLSSNVNYDENGWPTGPYCVAIYTDICQCVFCILI